MIRTHILYATAALTLIACTHVAQTEQQAMPGARCNTNAPNADPCDITLTVTASNDPANVCKVALASGQDTVSFKVRPGESPKIQWVISSPSDFRFRKGSGIEGIEFKDPAAPFTNGTSNPSGTVYSLNNKGKKNQNPGSPAEDYYYGIHLERKADGMRCGLDPLIRNQ